MYAVGAAGATGTTGTAGTRTAILDLYQWSAAAPTTFPVGTSLYTWATAQFASPATLNGWTAVPAAAVTGQTLWIVRAIYADTGTTAQSTVTWPASPTPYASGASGVNGQRVAELEVYQWAASAPALPTGTSTYTWSTGTFTAPSVAGGWSLLPGASSPGFTLWGTSVSLSNTGTSGTDLVTWTGGSVYAVGAAGATGNTGLTGTRGSKSFYVAGSAWTDAAANAAISGVYVAKVLLDQVTISNGSTFAQTKFWDGTSWSAIAATINGNLLVNGTIGAAALVGNSITGNQIAANVSLTTPVLAGGSITGATLEIGTTFSKSYIDTSGYVLGYGTVNRTEIAYAVNASTTGLRCYSANRLCAALTSFTAGSLVDAGELDLISYASGAETRRMQCTPVSLSFTGTASGAHSIVIDGVTGAITASGPLSVGSIVQAGIESTGSSLSVKVGGTVRGSYSAYRYTWTDGTVSGIVGVDSTYSKFELGTTTAHPLRFYTNNALRWEIHPTTGDIDGTAIIKAGSFKVGANQVVGSRGAAVAGTNTISGGGTGYFDGGDTISKANLVAFVNALCIAYNANAAAQNALRDRIATHGLIAT